MFFNRRPQNHQKLIIQGASAHTAGPVHGFVSLWCLGLISFFVLSKGTENFLGNFPCLEFLGEIEKQMSSDKHNFRFRSILIAEALSIKKG